MMDLLLLVSGCELWRPPLEVGESSFVVAVGCSAARPQVQLARFG